MAHHGKNDFSILLTEIKPCFKSRLSTRWCFSQTILFNGLIPFYNFHPIALFQYLALCLLSLSSRSALVRNILKPIWHHCIIQRKRTRNSSPFCALRNVSLKALNPRNPTIRLIRDADKKGRIADESDYADCTD